MKITEAFKEDKINFHEEVQEKSNKTQKQVEAHKEETNKSLKVI